MGLVLGRYFDSGDMAGPWLVILLGPPVALLIAPAYPIVSWQVPIASAVFCGVMRSNSPEDTVASLWGESALLWLVCSAFSLPWFLIFHYRLRRAKANRPPGFPLAYVGIGLLVFAVCAVTILGFALALYPSSTSPGPDAWYAFLMATGGVLGALMVERVAHKFGVHRPVRAVFQLLLAIAAVFAILIGWTVLAHQPGSASDSGLFFLAGLEAAGVLIWFIRSEKREANPAPDLSKPEH